MSRPGRMSARGRPAVGIALVLAGITVGLLLLEGLVRLARLDDASASSIGGFCRHDPLLGWTLVPGRSSTFTGRHFASRVVVSSQGLRDRVYPVARAPGRRRLLVLGDSAVWCWGVSMQDCFTERLEAALLDTEVIAAGVPGYGTAQEVLWYERDLRAFRPDRVLLSVVDNDLGENLLAEQRPRFTVQDGRLVLDPAPVSRRKGAVGEWLAAHSKLWRQLGHASSVIRNVAGSLRDRVAPQRADTYARLPMGREDEAWTLTELLLERLRRDVLRDGADLAIVVHQLDGPGLRRLAAWCATRGVPLFDAAPALRAAQARGQRISLRDDPHLNPLGHRVLATALLGQGRAVLGEGTGTNREAVARR